MNLICVLFIVIPTFPSFGKSSPKILVGRDVSVISYSQIIWPIDSLFTLSFPPEEEVAIAIIIIINRMINAVVTPAIIEYFFHFGISVSFGASDKISFKFKSIFLLKIK